MLPFYRATSLDSKKSVIKNKGQNKPYAEIDFLPFLRLRLKTARPGVDDILERNP